MMMMKLKNLLEEYYTHISDMQLQYHIDYVGSVNSIDEIRELIDVDDFYKVDDFECEEDLEEEDEIYDKQYFFYICKNINLNVLVVFDYFNQRFMTKKLL